MKQKPVKKSYTKKLVTSLAVVIGLAFAVLLADFGRDEDEQTNSINTQANLLFTQTTKEFAVVTEDKPVALPRDFALDPSYQHGWWHFFANVKDANGERYGVQWSFFRISNNPQVVSGWQNSQLYLSHIVVSNEKHVWKEQRIARGGIGQAGVDTAPFKVWLDNWSWSSLGRTPFPGVLSVETDNLNLKLDSVASGPFVLPGNRGYVMKGKVDQLASHNLTAPFIKVSGELALDGGPAFEIEGQAWMSKEWGSGLLNTAQIGWDWFVFHLDHQTTLSVHHYRYQDAANHAVATLSTSSGKVIPISQDEITIIPIQTSLLARHKPIPLEWMINIPKYDISLTTQVQNSNLWLPFVMPYWEGPIRTSGSHNSQGFMQLAGY
ncbi:lipocalin-like domain-containing protein [Vibrio panuliri]|uniref:lipocalin-like domain-containing protein n=1 Tax=Vibrio panuliri TaxID=1381081 RepID=UPI000951F6F4|nr:lipocalin-like domain-containing protein [Vibrio panuliri]KAB1454278.1 carotenoid 1,2-hydratase [Vibrio panuliri]